MSDPGDAEAEVGPESPERQVGRVIERLNEAGARSSWDLIKEILSRRLSERTTTDTFLEIGVALEPVLGAQGYSLLVGIADEGDLEEAIANLEQEGDVELTRDGRELIIRAVGTFGPQLSRAFHLSDHPQSRGRDWRSVGRRVIYNKSRERFEIEHEIERFDRERLDLVSGPGSVMRLVSRLLLSLEDVGDLSMVPERETQRFIERADAVKALLERSDSPDESEGG